MEYVLFDPAICNVFQKQAISGRPLVVLKNISRHLNPLGIHDRYACSISHELIADILIVIGKHKVKPITQIALTVIANDLAVLYKFKINSISVTGNIIVLYRSCLAI